MTLPAQVEEAPVAVVAAEPVARAEPAAAVMPVLTPERRAALLVHSD